jgi:hypothetical protein
MPYSYHYPEDKLNRIYPPDKTFDIKELKQKLPEKYLVNIYGLAGAGKGTTSRQLAKDLGVVHIDSGIIHRSITYVYLDTGLECTPDTIKEVMEVLDISLHDDGIRSVYKGQVLTVDQIRSPEVSSKVASYAENDFEQFAFFEIMYEMIKKYGKPVVLDGRGGQPPHIEKLEKEGFQIYRIILEIDDEINIKRYIKAYTDKQKLKDNDFILTKEEEEKMREEFGKTILARNQKDLDWMRPLYGIYEPGSAILDTSTYNIQSCVDACLVYMQSNIDKNQ